MLKPPMPNVAGMTDTLEFIKQLWGGMNIPGMPGVSGLASSTLSTDELDKKIADLKAVESWLNLNIGMLRGTIQALEVQRGTLAALKTMSESMAQAMGKTGGDAPMAPFAQFFSQAAPATPAGAQAGSAPPPRPEAGVSDGASAPGAGAAMPAAVAWWNLLQEQFRQAVAGAMPAEVKDGEDKRAASTGAAPGTSASGDTPSGAPADASPAGNGAPGRGARTARSKADKA